MPKALTGSGLRAALLIFLLLGAEAARVHQTLKQGDLKRFSSGRNRAPDYAEAADAKCEDVPLDQRTDCLGHLIGARGGPDNCAAASCCWGPVEPNPDNRPWCYIKVNMTSNVAQEYIQKFLTDSAAADIRAHKMRAIHEAAERTWQEANHQCVWSTADWKCISKNPQLHFDHEQGQDEGKCKWRGMWLDKSWDEGCRLADDWQLKTDATKWLEIRMGQAEQKIMKYSRDCMGSAGSYSPWCWRRSRHISRAAAFLAQAQDPKYNLHETQIEMANKVMEAITELMTRESPHAKRITKLMNSAKSKVETSKGVGGVGIMRRVAKVMGCLLMADEISQSDAVKFVDDLPDDDAPVVDAPTEPAEGDVWTFSPEELMEDAGMEAPFGEKITLTGEELVTSLQQFDDGLGNMSAKLEESQTNMEVYMDDLEGVEAGCTTAGNYGVSGGMACVFPFIYHDKSYDACTSDDFTTKWCAVEVDSTGVEVDGQWGDCAMTCENEIHLNEKNNGDDNTTGDGLLELATKSKGPTAWLVGATSAVVSALLLLKTQILHVMVTSKLAAGLHSTISAPGWMGFAQPMVQGYVNSSIAGFSSAMAAPILWAGLIGYVVLCAYTCTLLAGILPWRWGMCFLKGLALPFMVVGNIVECFGALVEGAIRRGWPKYFRCQPLPIFSGFWDPRFPQFEQPKVNGVLTPATLARYVKEKLYHDGVGDNEIKEKALMLLGGASSLLNANKTNKTR